jgi:hypothetical protein
MFSVFAPGRSASAAGTIMTFSLTPLRSTFSASAPEVENAWFDGNHLNAASCCKKRIDADIRADVP